ncbi:MAG: methyltransferase domain-containing protein [Clostridiales bacterium]|nr:methyltransferase domain-containing protein [Clostridiales bacterium]
MIDNRSAYNSNVYDANIINTLPYYREYHNQIMDLVRAIGLKDISWLDTGCGTGTLCSRVLEERDDVRFTLCDPSEQMLERAKEKLQGRDIRFLNMQSQDLTFDSEFDVVTAVQCHHYLKPDARRTAVMNCCRALKENGVFVTFENIKMTTGESDSIALKRWENFLSDHLNDPEKVAHHMNRRGVEVFPITIEEHIKLLRECGFESVDVLWTSYLQAGFWAIKG